MKHRKVILVVTKNYSMIINIPTIANDLPDVIIKNGVIYVRKTTSSMYQEYFPADIYIDDDLTIKYTSSCCKN